MNFTLEILRFAQDDKLLLFALNFRHNTIMLNITKHLTIIILAGILCGCTSQILPNQAANYRLSWPTRQRQLRKITNWQLRGYMTMQSPQENFTAFLNWKQQAKNYAIYLSGPLGIGTVHIYGRPGRFILQTAEGKKYIAKTPKQLVRQQLGWKLPISSLYYWIRGIPVPRVHAIRYFDNYNRLTELDQQGWKIYYQNYTYSAGIDLPSAIILCYPNLSVRIVISQWLVKQA
jgi:outer membrane lipoprotein LolB